MKWIDIWDQEPPRHELILFLTNDGKVHIGTISGTESLRKSEFFSHLYLKFYECDRTMDILKVIAWHPIPKKLPEGLENAVDRYMEGRAPEV